MDHSAFLRGYQSGAIQLGVDRVEARRLYTVRPLSELRDLIGATPYLQKAVVSGLHVLGPLLFLASLGLCFLGVRWWVLGLGPVALVVYALYWTMSPRGSSGGVLISVLTIGTWFLALTGIVTNQSLSFSVAAFLTSLWANRMVYLAATAFVRAAVVESPVAFSNLAGLLTLVGSSEGTA